MMKDKTAIKAGQSLFNTNGKTYDVLEHSGSYSLLYEHGKSYHPYIVAHDLAYYTEEKDGDLHGSWGGGRYFDELEGALLTYKDLAGIE